MKKIYRAGGVDDRGNIISADGERALYSGRVLMKEDMVDEAEDHGWTRSNNQTYLPLVQMERYIIQTKKVRKGRPAANAGKVTIDETEPAHTGSEGAGHSGDSVPSGTNE